jgi:acetyl-CoA carboxylase biotin carboxyl carrier protein
MGRMSRHREGSGEEDAMRDVELADEQALVEPVAVGPGGDPGAPLEGPPDLPPDVPDAPDAPDAPAGAPEAATPDAATPDDGAAAGPLPAPALAGADASLLALVDRLTAVLERSDLGELEVGAGGTTIVLRAPMALERPAGLATAVADPSALEVPAPGASAASAASTPGAAEVTASRPSVTAPLTGIFYRAPSPGAMPYVAEGDHVSVGQIIGLIEAMKLFNEIKSDLAGRVVRVCAESGALVKAKQALIEVEPA